MVVDPFQQSVTWFRRGDGGFVAADGSDLLRVGAAELAARLDWPPTG